MNIQEVLLDSWDRQSKIVDSVCSLINEGNKHFRPSEDGMRLDEQLAHMHGTRRYFLSQIAPELAADVPSAYQNREGTPLEDLNAIKAHLVVSSAAVKAAVFAGLKLGGPMVSTNVTYDNPVLFLQHMLWHEGWHVGLIFLALRVNGQEPPEEWEEPNVWGKWRTETW